MLKVHRNAHSCNQTLKVKEVILPSKGYAEDTAGKFTTFDNNNKGWHKRKQMFKESKWVYFCINLHSDITTLRKFFDINMDPTPS